jgi:hypothetical protein
MMALKEFAMKGCHLAREGLIFASRSDWLLSRLRQRTIELQSVYWNTRDVGKTAGCESSRELCYLLGGIDMDFRIEPENVKK